MDRPYPGRTTCIDCVLTCAKNGHSDKDRDWNWFTHSQREILGVFSRMISYLHLVKLGVSALVGLGVSSNVSLSIKLVLLIYAL